MLKSPICFWFVLLASLLLLTGASTAHSQETGKLYVIGSGPSGPELAAPMALQALQDSHRILSHKDTKQRFSEHITDEKYAFNPWDGIHGGDASELRRENRSKWLERVEERSSEVREFAMEHIREGRSVAMVDSGDPCVYGPSLGWLLEDFPREHMEVIPGISAFNAASAALEQPMIGEAGFIMLTSASSLLGEEDQQATDLLKDMAQYKPTMVLYMALDSLKELTREMKKHYPEDLPAAIVYYAGYPEKEEVIRGTLEDIYEKSKQHPEDWLGMVFMGEAVH